MLSGAKAGDSPVPMPDHLGGLSPLIKMDKLVGQASWTSQQIPTLIYLPYHAVYAEQKRCDSKPLSEAIGRLGNIANVVADIVDRTEDVSVTKDIHHLHSKGKGARREGAH